MPGLVAISNASAQELAAWRRKTEKGRVRQTKTGYYWTDGKVERAVSIRRPNLPEAMPTDDPNTGTLEPLAPLPHTRRPAREIRDAMTDRRIEAMTRLANRSPEFWQTVVDEYIAKFRPELLQGRTREEAIRIIVEAQNRDAVQQAFKRKGRDNGNAG